ncbi:hypothetical protein ACN47E_006565 [Coniothyrium glycines]
METRRLTNSDMKKLVQVFRNHPHNASVKQEAKYCKHTKEAIHNLPRRLRSSQSSMSVTNLCSTHKSLDAHLTNDIWAWLRHEFDGAIGKFLYPIVMSGRLAATQELQARQLEPVLQMWHSDFKLEASAPIGHDPIDCSDQWTYQRDQCPGCMLARVGSDDKVLLALFAGMVGHFSTRNLTTADTLRTIVGWDKPRSKRIRFVRYWIQATKHADALLSEAGELGVVLKQLRREWKIEQRRMRDAHNALRACPGLDADIQGSTPASTFRDNPFSDQPPPTVASDRSASARQSQSRAAPMGRMDLSDPYQYKDWSCPPRYDTKLGPVPRPHSAERLAPAAPLGFEELNAHHRKVDGRQSIAVSQSECARRASVESYSTVRPGSSASMVGLYPPPLQPRRAQRVDAATAAPKSVYGSIVNECEDSVIGDQVSVGDLRPSTAKRHESSMISTILSYDGPGVSKVGPSRGPVNDPLDNYAYHKIETMAEKVQRYRDIMTYRADIYGNPCKHKSPFDDDAGTLPEPKRQSMYSSFGVGPFEDRFATVDEDFLYEKEAGCDDEPDDAPGAPNAH